MCLSVHQLYVCLLFCFQMITWVDINEFSSNLVCALILWRSGLGLLMGKFRQILTEIFAWMVGYYSLKFLFLHRIKPFLKYIWNEQHISHKILPSLFDYPLIPILPRGRHGTTVLSTSFGKTFFAWRFILNENILFWMTISYQKPFVFFFSVFCSQNMYLKIKFIAKNWSDLCNFYSEVILWNFCLCKYFLLFFAEFE